ncbi:hypothetical protein HCN51_46470 [Nonomuraea sp. FMUSA5-5]|uniref:CAP domain-containing protein n=1 Tax=Nonomuraea composti TaxID=2720023 RepID=A0ABX1BJS8_9ACTN|nr:hypothetical protein [Nonomuraea sp. FMUSA5-5]NJP96794.1 hypothetical protein [Nonomuraea sp. FMUSA5-5]
MRQGARKLSTSAMLVSLMVLTGCSGDADIPSLDEVSKQLITDGDKLIASRELAATGSATATERADRESDAGCLKGQVQRFFRAQGDLNGPPYKHSPGNAAGLMASWLQVRGYSRVVDDLDLHDENLGVAVLRNPQTGITFMIAVRNGQKPHIRIVGKTSCYERAG